MKCLELCKQMPNVRKSFKIQIKHVQGPNDQPIKQLNKRPSSNFCIQNPFKLFLCISNITMATHSNGKGLRTTTHSIYRYDTIRNRNIIINSNGEYYSLNRKESENRKLSSFPIFLCLFFVDRCLFCELFDYLCVRFNCLGRQLISWRFIKFAGID